MASLRTHCLTFVNWLLPPRGVLVIVVAVCTGLEWLVLWRSHFNELSLNEGGKVHLLIFFSVVPLFWITTAWVVYWYARTLHCLLRPLTKRRVFLGALVASIPLCLLVFFYCLSWGFYFRTGVLPDIDVLHFSAINMNMLGKYFWQSEPRVLIEMVALALGAVGGCGTIMLRLTSYQRQKRISVMPLVIAVWILLNLVCIPIVFDYSDAHVTDRATAYRLSNHAVTFDLTRKVNPVLSWLNNSTFLDDSAVGTNIPLEALPPRSTELRKASSLKSDIEPSRHPNILVIVVESLRADVVDAVHQDQQVMPNMNRLSREGCLFTRSYAQSVHSDYSDPCIVSSLYPLRSTKQYFYQRSVAWPKVLLWDVLKPLGYSTAMFSSQNEAWSNMHLFYQSASLDVLFDSRSAASSSFIPKDDSSFAKWVADTGLAGKLDDRLTAQAALNWVADCENINQPWQCVVNFQTSHFPYHLPKGQVGGFEAGEFDFEASLLSWDIRHQATIKNAYFNALRYIDDRLGEILTQLEQLDALQRTIIVVTGDHGEAMGEVGEVGHGQSLIETTCRVPLIIYYKDQVPPQQSDYLSQAVDIVPTLLGLAGHSTHPAFQGIDLLSYRRLPKNQRIVFVHRRVGGIGADTIVSATGWKLIKSDHSPQLQLYFRPTDLAPSIELSRDFPEVTDILHALLMEWRERQIAYYRHSNFHQLFFAPRSPEMSSQQSTVLLESAMRLQDHTK